MNKSRVYYFMFGDLNISINLLFYLLWLQIILPYYLNMLISNSVARRIITLTRATTSIATTSIIDHIFAIENRLIFIPFVTE